MVDNILYQNIVPVWGDIEDLEGTRLRDDSIDAILVSNVFFLLKHKKTAIMEMKRILRKYGKILFIDWHTQLGKSTKHKASILDESRVIQDFSEMGFEVTPKNLKDELHFALIMEKR